MSRLTLESLLTPPARGRLRAQAHLFCATPDCSVVYFSSTGAAVFSEADVAVRVTQKAAADPVPLCYCFGYTRADVEREIRETGTTAIPGRIAADVKAGTCRCEVTNPQGTCCLGNVAAAVAAVSGGGRRDASPTASTGRAGLLAGGGALAAGVLASACCLGPLVLGGLGLGALGAAGALERFRPVLLVVTALLLAGAFRIVYRKRGVGCADGSCRTGGGPAVKAGVWVVAMITAGAAAFPHLPGVRQAPAGAEAAIPGGGRIPPGRFIEDGVVVVVTGMTCEGCAGAVTTALKGVDGVRDVRVSLKDGRAVVAGGGGAGWTARLVAAVRAAGYGARAGEEDDGGGKP